MSILAIVFLSLSLVQSGEPELASGELRPLGAATDLARDVSGVAGPAWVGYAVPAAAHADHACRGVFDLDRGGGYGSNDPDEGEGTELFVFFRVDGNTIEEVRAVESGCRVRADGVVYWLSGVTTDESIDFLESVVRREPRSELAEQSVHAIARHRGARADQTLVTLAGDAWPLDVREKAVFWMGAARGEAGYQSLVELLRSVDERELLEKIVFALHVSDVEDATTTLIDVARRNADSDVREKAIFWLGQEAGARATAAILGAIEDDPDIEVKEKAVFALSQLPADEGIPLLVEVAETHPRPEIRKKAFFWLGQSNDPRALALFERVLLN